MTAIRKEGRAVDGFPVFPQNAQQLVVYPGYLDAVDGVGREDTWFVGYDDRREPGRKASASDSQRLEYELEPLRKINAAGKTVLVVDYFDPAQLIRRGFVKRRGSKLSGVSGGHAEVGCRQLAFSTP